MPLLNDADKVYVGAAAAQKAYLGGALVWSAMDPATSAYLAATGLPAGYAPALDGLVRGLKDYGLWAKMQAVYPFIGGTPELHKWNLMDPRDLDAAYRLTYIQGGASIHSDALGYRANTEGNGINGGYADTNLIPANGLADVDSTHLAFYSLAEVPPGDRAEIGCYNWNGTGSRFHLIVCYAGNSFYYGMSEEGATYTSSPSSTGLFVSTRTSATTTTAYRNGVSVDTSPQPANNGLPTFSVWVGGIDSYRGRSDLPCGFASIGSGLTAQNVADLNTVVQAYQTALNRTPTAPPPWTPASISGLGLWLEADKITGLSDGAPVTSWPDASPANHPVTPRATPPKWRQAGMGGRPTVEFSGDSGADNRMTIGGWGDALSGKSEYTLFQVITQNSFGAYPVITSAPTYSAWNWITEYNTDASIYWGAPNGSHNRYDAQVVASKPTLLTYCLGLGTGPKFYKDGVQVTSFVVTGGGMAQQVPSLGSDVLLGGYYADGFGLDGQFAAMLWYDRFLIDSERHQVEDYLKTKYGL